MDYEDRSNFNTDVYKALINGEIVEYDMADDGWNRAPKDYPGWKFIGTGVLYSIGDVLQEGRFANHFWQRI